MIPVKRMLVGVGLPTLLVIMACIIPVGHMPATSERTMAVLVAAIWLWTAAVLPVGSSSLALIVIINLLHLVPSYSASVEGFTSPVVLFYASVTLLSTALLSSGLVGRITEWIIRSFRMGPRANLLLLAVLINGLFPFLMPSAVGRAKSLWPLVEEMERAYGFSPDSSIYRKVATVLLGPVNQAATMAALTGGVMTVVTAGILEQAGHPVSWVGWIVWMSVPLWASNILAVARLFIQYWRHPGWRERQAPPEEAPKATAVESAPWTRNERVVAIIFAALIVTWALGSTFGVSSIISLMAAVSIFAFPGLEILPRNFLKEVDWDIIVMFGAALSLGDVLIHNGTAHYFGQLLIGMQHVGGVHYSLVILALLVFLTLSLRFFSVNSAAALSIILPVTFSITSSVGLPSVPTILLLVFLAGSMAILPIQAPGVYFMYQVADFPLSEAVPTGLWQLAAAVVVGIMAFLWYWPLVT